MGEQMTTGMVTGGFFLYCSELLGGRDLDDSFKDMTYFSTRVSFLYKGQIMATKVNITSILLRAAVVVSESLTVNNSFFGVLGMVAWDDC